MFNYVYLLSQSQVDTFQEVSGNVQFKLRPVLYKRYFRCNNCFLLLVYTIHLSLSTDMVDPPPMGTINMKHALYM